MGHVLAQIGDVDPHLSRRRRKQGLAMKPMSAEHLEQPSAGTAPDSATGIFHQNVDIVLVSVVPDCVCCEFSAAPSLESAETAGGPDQVFARASLQEGVDREVRKAFRNAKTHHAVTIEPR